MYAARGRCYFEIESGRHQFLGVGLLRLFEDLFRGALFDYHAVTHDYDVMTEGFYDAQIVADEDITQVVSLLQRRETKSLP